MEIEKKNIIDQKIKKIERENLLNEANQNYSQLKNSDKLWQEELKDRSEWDTTLFDGLDYI